MSYNICFATFQLHDCRKRTDVVQYRYMKTDSAFGGATGHDVYEIVMDIEDVIATDEHSVDEGRIRALMDQYADQEATARLEE
jgi:hypothetical protein